MSSILPQDPDGNTSHSPEPCACGHDETDHGAVIVGCIHCRNCDRYIPRSTYVPRPAADSREQVAQVLLSWAKEIVNHETSRDPYNVADEIAAILADVDG